MEAFDKYDKQNFFKKNSIWIVAGVAIIIFGVLLFNGWDRVVNTGIDGMTTITGHFSCLPPKDIVQEEECELGIRSRDGSYYALDVSRLQDANTDLVVEDTIAVTGTIQPRSTIKDSQWSDYDIKAIIKVNTLLRTR